ncbi:MAG: hypothetical protein IT375_14505 [Polyangiaceae bacterium]|nr:hypothetical protein [Polyangiaceae bacterium]
MMRWLLPLGLVVLLGAGCGSENTSGPPSAPCSEQVKSAAICGQDCKDLCGCSACQPGSQMYVDGTAYVCQNGCFAQGSAGGSGGGGTGGGSGATGGKGGTGGSSGGTGGKGGTGGSSSGGAAGTGGA